VSVVVLGDTLLDIDLVGTATRLCPDAPAPVVDIERKYVRPGGAGLAAALIAADGIPVTLVTAIAADADGERLREILGGVEYVAGPAFVPTPVKTRLRCAGHSLMRMDRSVTGDPPVWTDEMIDLVRAADAVLVSDYGRGLTGDPRLRDAVSRLIDRIPVVWDPHLLGAQPVAGVSLTTPNSAEATAASGIDDYFQAATVLREKWSADAVAVTVGSHGAILDVGEVPVAVPAPQVPVVDTCGAGDKFAGAVTTGLLAGESTMDAVRAGVRAATRFLAGGGVARFGKAYVLSRGGWEAMT
jgi:rfaE bifunctional protein kinase chain/domain